MFHPQKTLIVCGCGLLLSCTYELKNDGKSAYRLNRLTGEVAVISGNAITIAESPKPNPVVPTGSSSVTTRSNTIPNLDNLEVVLKTRWRDGSLVYIVTLSPFNAKIRASFGILPKATVTMDLEDEDSFQVASLPVILNQCTRIVDEKGEPQSLVYKGSVLMSIETYNSIRSLSSSWSGF